MISVIVPALNEAPQIVYCLRSLNDQSIDKGRYEIIVVDGGSVDQTCSIAERYADKVIIQTDPGIGGARRNGAEAASGRVLAFTDADTILYHNWLEVINRNLGRHEASTGPVIFQDSSIRTELLGAWRRSYNLLNIINFYYLIGSNMAVRSDTYRKIGGHSNISLLDDYDLSRKLFRNGSDTVYDPEQTVYTSSRRTTKLLTYGMTVAYGHYNYLVAKDYEKLLNYPKVDEMTVRDILKENRLGRNVLDSVGTIQSSLQQTIRKIT